MIGRVGTLAAGLVLSLTAGIGVAESEPSTCRMSQLALTLGPGISEATGQHTLAVRLRNRGAASCVLDGYPTITAVDRGGPVPFLIRHGTDQMIRAHRPARLVVRPGRAAFVVLNHYRCDVGVVREATAIRVALPRAARAGAAVLRIADRYRRLDYCGRGDPGSTLTVSPFEPSVRAALGG